MRLFGSKEVLEEDLDRLIRENMAHIALVAADVPLISNLDVVSNVALIMEYRDNVPRKKAEDLVVQYLSRYHLEPIARKRNPALTHKERFHAMLLRAAMVSDAMIVIDRPLNIMPDLRDDLFFFNTLNVIEDRFTACHILDYHWNKHRYGNIETSENGI